MTAVDAVAKKIAFLRHLCRGLALPHVECVASRVEHLGGTYDVIVSRAAGPLPYLLTLSVPLLKNDGCLLLQRGPQALQELSAHANELCTMGFHVAQTLEIRFSWLKRPRYLVELHRINTA